MRSLEAPDAVRRTTTMNGYRSRIPYFVPALAMGFPALLLGVQISGWIFFLPGAMQGHCDFRHLYTAGYMLRTGQVKQIYEYDVEHDFQNRLVSKEDIALPFNHLAYEALVFVSYSYTSYRAGYFAFLATNLLLLAIVIYLVRPRTANLHKIFSWLPAAIVVTFTPVAAALMQGQDSILILALFTLALTLIDREKGFWSGILIGFGAAKLQMVLPIAILCLLWRRWRFVMGFSFSFAAVLLISTLMVGPAHMGSYFHSLLSMSVTQTTADETRISPLMMPNLRGLIYALTAKWLSRAWVQTLTGVCSLAVLAAASRLGDGRKTGEQLVLGIVATAFISYYIYTHDLSLMLLPILAILDEYASDFTGTLNLRAIAAVLVFVSPGLFGLFPVHAVISSVPILFLLLTLLLRPKATMLRSSGLRVGPAKPVA